ncbi:MAG: hypothetical protein ACD_28C00332G0003 [uncultured bacterium]|nr:MAG: hypothetical protein ACD_28C00332G0003 [uncultured bacterium]KKT76225.1 MAG: hypothetical protein UW70_C0020G0003 [Candidatus Peregrinibacteria bacterium GW2011_GWA2_44_7]
MSVDKKWEGMAKYAMAELAVGKKAGSQKLAYERVPRPTPSPKKLRPEHSFNMGILDPEQEGFLNSCIAVYRLDAEYESFSALGKLKVEDYFIPVELVIYTKGETRNVRLKFCADESSSDTVFYKTTEVVLEARQRIMSGKFKEAVALVTDAEASLTPTNSKDPDSSVRTETPSVVASSDSPATPTAQETPPAPILEPGRNLNDPETGFPIVDSSITYSKGDSSIPLMSAVREAERRKNNGEPVLLRITIDDQPGYARLYRKPMGDTHQLMTQVRLAMEGNPWMNPYDL